MDRQKVRECLDHTPLLSIYELYTTIALEFVSSTEFFGFAVVADAVIEGNIGFWEDEA